VRCEWSLTEQNWIALSIYRRREIEILYTQWPTNTAWTRIHPQSVNFNQDWPYANAPTRIGVLVLYHMGKTREIFDWDFMGFHVKYSMQFSCHVGKNIRSFHMAWKFYGDFHTDSHGISMENFTCFSLQNSTGYKTGTHILWDRVIFLSYMYSPGDSAIAYFTHYKCQKTKILYSDSCWDRLQYTVDCFLSECHNFQNFHENLSITYN